MEIDDAQKYIQTRGLGLDKCKAKMNALLLFLGEERDTVVSEAHATAIRICE